MTDAAPSPVDAIKAKARALDFNAVGVSSAALPEIVGRRLMAFLDAGRHGDMTWMADRAEERKSPDALWPAAKSAIVLLMNYGPRENPLARLERRERGVISVYGLNRDYHDIVKKRLKQMARWAHAEFGGDVKVFVDTAPVMEKPLARKAGIGWQGKHTNLVSRAYGSWTFIGVVLTTLALPTDAEERDHCGSCRQCLDICPTNAFPAPYQLDARRCISYLTIELKGPIPRQFRKAMGNRIYGCDDCLAICPWNKFASEARETAFHARAELEAPLLAELALLDDAAFRALFKGSPVKRVGRDRFVRNVAIALGNAGPAAPVDTIRMLTRDDSPLVRGAAVWAAAQHLPADRFAAWRREDAPAECDETVLGEWRDGAIDAGGADDEGRA